MSDIKLTEGDIYHWRWSPKKVDDLKTFWGNSNLYHCKSQIAVVSGGVLKDTFWGQYGSDGYLNPEDVVLELKGNPSTMKAINEYEQVFYRPEDLVNMNHSNNSRAPVYAKVGRNADVMVAYYRERISANEREIKWCQDRIRACEEAIALVERGDVDANLPVWSKP